MVLHRFLVLFDLDSLPLEISLTFLCLKKSIMNVEEILF